MSTHLRQFKRFAQYNAWFNGRVFELAGQLPDDEHRKNLSAFFKSIHGTLNHLLLVDRLWLGRISKHPQGFASLQKTPLVFEFESLGQILYDDFKDLSSGRRETDDAISSWVRELRPDTLETDLSYARSNGQMMSIPFWHAAAHLFNHQTHHRGQVSTLLYQLGRDLGVTDFLTTAFMPEDAA